MYGGDSFYFYIYVGYNNLASRYKCNTIVNFVVPLSSFVFFARSCGSYVQFIAVLRHLKPKVNYLVIYFTGRNASKTIGQ